MKRKTREFAFFLFFAGLCLPSGPSSQLSSLSQEAVRPQKPLQHEVSVTLKLIQVVVTDRKGNPVRNLKKDDFILTDDGNEQKLTEFEEHVLTLPAEAAPTEVRIDRTPIASSPRLLGRKFFLFFDYAYGGNIRKARDVALNFLDTKLSPLDEIGVASYSGLKRLQVHLFLTADHQQVRDLVATIGERESSERNEDLEDKYQRELKSGAFADARPEMKLTKPMPTVSGFNLEALERHQAEMCLDSLTAFAQALRYIPGQKYLVFFSEGIPYRTLYRGDRISLVGGKPADQFAELRNKHQNLLKELATSNVTVYAMHTGPISAASEIERSGTLQMMAYATGGQFWGNIYNYKPFVEKIQTMTASYYVLGYPVSEKWDGKYHKINVRVKRPGCEVRAQGGYFNPKLFTDYTDIEKQIHLVDLALADKPLSQIPVRFDMAALPRSTETSNNLLFAAAIPVEKLREMIGKKIEVVSLAFNAADEIVKMRRTEESLARLTEKSAHLLSILSVAPGDYKCRIVLRDLETGRAAVAAAAVTIPEKPKSGIRLLPPLLLKPNRGALYFKTQGPDASADTKDGAPDLKSLVAFDIAQYVPQLERTLYRASEAWAVIRCAVPDGETPKLKLSAFLWDKTTQQNISMPLAVIEEKTGSGMRTFFTSMAVPDVEPDEYTLHVVAADEVSGVSSEIVCDFAVEDSPKKDRAAR